MKPHLALGTALLGFLSTIAQGAGSVIVPPALDPAKLNNSNASAIKERQKLDEKSLRQNTPSPPSQESAQPPAGATLGSSAGQGQSVPMVDLPLPAQQSGPFSSAAEDPDLIPLIREAPKAGISAWLGQTLALRAKASPKVPVTEKTSLAWVLNGAVVCWGEECRIPLDGKLVGPGLSSLVVVAYNAHGSTMSRHVVRVVRGYWNPSMPFSDKHVRTEAPEPVTVVAPVVNRQSLWAQMIEGNAVHAYPENVNIVGAVPRNLSWTGQLKTSPRGVLKMNGESGHQIFLLGGSDVFLEGESSGKRAVRLNRGTLRAHVPRSEKGEGREAQVETREMSLLLAPGSDGLVWRISPAAKALLKRRQQKPKVIPKDEQYQTRVVLISGVGKFRVSNSATNESKYTEFPSGVELTVYEDGTIAPLGRPNATRLEAALKRTMSTSDLAALAKKKEEVKKSDFNLSEHLKKVEELSEREEYFEVLSELALVADRSAEDVRIPYHSGLAYKGLYQPKEAETQFRKAMEQDSAFADAPWQLGLMYLDDKKWAEAAQALDAASSHFSSDDKRKAEYEYYGGVSRFQLGADFTARNHFTRALLWHPELEETLKGSAAEFLKKLRERKRWSAVLPMGVQWDGNPLQLPAGQALPEGFSSRGLLRALTGLMFTWDPASSVDGPGTFRGWGANIMYAKHFPSSYSSFDMLILGGNLSQTWRRELPSAKATPAPLPASDGPAPAGTPPPAQPQPAQVETLKLAETLTLPLVKNKIQNVTLALNASYQSFDGTLGVEYDVASSADSKRHALTGREVYPWGLWENEAGSRFEIELSSDQRFAFKTSESHGHSAGFTLSPGFQYAFTALTSTTLTVAMGALKNFYGEKTLALKGGPALALNMFLAPWLMGSASVSFEVSKETGGDTKHDPVTKPGASLMLSGIF